MNSGKNLVFKRTLNLLIETKSSRVGTPDSSNRSYVKFTFV
ncbi:hypothetical protein LEP1GSC102_3048 [Leptospira interrogans str. UI 09600]|nr:hypothetical protein LEP1GSC069_2544 [Leptospira interrogans serovar Canicola str. Fiocruz LV133]EMN76039.1 hypothetical protein LEP1GSC102_3048 [Leptospira interrogans str. UI 09600]EMN94469.1 hypothetical protein LEP1GSC110_1641 [Leptospira interrogans serovar Medanensis str. UT053]